ncbi:hypothetical protein EC988_001608 [Linderina pennispora]|nr:hypothetical protein EC988_001608 [Linderina pennispora]
MGTFRNALTDADQEWIRKQKVFFMASAPLAKDGHVNLSPRGYDSLRVLNANRVIHLDGRGSGCETIAHLRENKRITLMLCAFEGSPKIMRLFGTGRVYEPGTPEFDALFEEHFSEQWKDPAKFKFVRSIIDIQVEMVGQSCGFAVPFMDYKAERETLVKVYAERSEELALKRRIENNTRSIDGLPSYLNGTDPGNTTKIRLMSMLDAAAPWLGGIALGAAAAAAVFKNYQ